MTTSILLYALGLAFIAAEVLIPSGGLLGFGALAAFVASVVTAYQVSGSFGTTFLIVTCVSIPIVVSLAVKLLPYTPFGRLMINGGLSFKAQDATDDRDLGLVGQRGEVLTPLRPAGHARIDGRRVDVVSRGESLEPGTSVQVVEVRGNRVVVARAEALGAPAAE